MIGFSAAIIVAIFSIFLLSVGGLMVLKPNVALTALRHMGSTRTIHFSELSLRFLAGAGVYGFALQSPNIQAFQIAGVFLMVTSVLIMLVPHKLHSAYARWWADKFTSPLIRVLSLPPIAIGVWLLKTAMS